MLAWNNFLWPKVILVNGKYQTLPILISNLTAAYDTDYGLVMLTVTITSSPTWILFLVMQRAFAEGLTGPAKGWFLHTASDSRVL